MYRTFLYETILIETLLNETLLFETLLRNLLKEVLSELKNTEKNRSSVEKLNRSESLRKPLLLLQKAVGEVLLFFACCFEEVL